jgi:hypothetical protein
MFMPKQPLSVTLEEHNITWLRGREIAGRRRSLSETLDAVVTAARLGGRPGEARSVVGTIDIAPGDATLATADAEIREMFQAALAVPGRARANARTTARSRSMPRGRGRG